MRCFCNEGKEKVISLTKIGIVRKAPSEFRRNLKFDSHPRWWRGVLGGRKFFYNCSRGNRLKPFNFFIFIFKKKV